MASFNSNDVRVRSRSRRPWCRHDALLDDNDDCRLADDDASERVADDLKSRFRRLLSNEDMSDVTLVVRKSDTTTLRVPAHRLVLAVASPTVLRRLLFGESPPSEVLVDADASVLLEFLRFCYADDVDLNDDNAVAVLALANKFCVASLTRLCQRFVRSRLTPANAIAVWQSARQFGECEFERLALRVIQTFAKEAFVTEAFLRLDGAELCLLLGDDLLRVDEIDVFRALMRWTKQQCARAGVCPTRANCRQLLRRAAAPTPLLGVVRFSLIADHDKQKLVLPEGVVADDGLFGADRRPERLFQRLHAGDATLATVQRFESFDDQLPNRVARPSLVFSTDRRVFVAGVGLYGPRKPCAFYLHVTLSISRTCAGQPPVSGVEVVEQSALVKCDATQPIVNVRLDEPFEIEPLVEYEVRAHMRASETSLRSATSLVKARLNPNLFYTKPNHVNYFYGVCPKLLARVRTRNQEAVVFNFFADDADDAASTVVSLQASSAPATPHPPARPPPPLHYEHPTHARRRRRLSSRLKRVFSFQERMEDNDAIAAPVVSGGQIPVLMFF